MRLHTHYYTDECTNESLLNEKLEDLLNQGKITYNFDDRWILKITDRDLTPSDETELIELIESLDLYPVEESSDEDEEGYDNYNSDDY